jgi:polysaccharide deacetylase 2 family uncharacterized protein YibQ
LKEPKLKYLLPLTGVLLVIILILLVPLRKIEKEKPVLPPKAFRGKIAIVLDDFGYNLNNLPALSRIKEPLTLAILPNLAYSGDVSRKATRLGFEIILHLPMQPKEKFRLEKETIMISMGKEDIRRILDAGLDSIASVKGVSNHMGSMATADPHTMEIILRQLKAKRLYFLDSYVTAGSECPRLAAKTGVRSAKRDIFLDNVLEPQAIRRQLRKLKERAMLNGYAIGIGHDRKATIQVLSEELPRLEKEGYQFVFVSELTK